MNTEISEFTHASGNHGRPTVVTVMPAQFTAFDRRKLKKEAIDDHDITSGFSIAGNRFLVAYGQLAEDFDWPNREGIKVCVCLFTGVDNTLAGGRL